MAFSETLTPDGGPTYTETNWNRPIREPFNAVTAAVFFVMAAVWFWRLKGDCARQRITLLCIALLAVGGIGGTLYHALRTSQIFLLLDFMPIALIMMVVVFHLWRRLLGRHWPGFLIFAGFIFLQRVLHQFVPRPFSINLSYALIGLMILAPLISSLYRNHWRGVGGISIAVGLFALALFCRVLDPHSAGYLSIGTHWLWHLFASGSTWLLIQYLSNFERIKSPERLSRPR